MIKKHIPLDRIWAIKATEKKLRSPKAWIFLWLTLVAYGLIFFRLFGQFLALESMIYVMLFFLFFHFFYLEVRKLPIKYLLILMLGVTALQGLFIGYSHIFLVGAMFSINMGIVYFAWFLQGESHEKTIRSSLGYFNVWWYIFTVFITVAYSFFVVGYYEKFPFTCEWLSQASNSVIDFVAKPFKLWLDEAKDIKASTQSFFSSKLWDVVSASQNITIQPSSEWPKFLERLNIYKKQLIDQTIQDNTKVNMWICDYILGEINNIYNTPGVKFSVIALLFLLLYGFIRIEFWVMTGIAIIFFKILYALRIYRIKKIMKEVEELE